MQKHTDMFEFFLQNFLRDAIFIRIENVLILFGKIFDGVALSNFSANILSKSPSTASQSGGFIS